MKARFNKQVLIAMLAACSRPRVIASGYVLPQASLRDVLALYSHLSNRRITVAHHPDLDQPLPLVLPGPITAPAARQAIAELLHDAGFQIQGSVLEYRLEPTVLS